MLSKGASQRLFIVNHFVAAYRKGLYDRVGPRLGEHGIQLQVVGHRSPPSLVRRDDAVEAPWVVAGQVRWLPLFGKELAIRRYQHLNLRPTDLLLVQQALKNLDTYALLARRSLGGPSVAMWGHGKTYSTPQGRLARGLKMALTRRADWFFGYTPAGVEYVTQRGFPPERTTVLWNTLDTELLSADLGRITDAQAAAFRAEHVLTPRKTALFLGGVDPAKGIQFLLEAAVIAGQQLPGFKLLVCGSGDSLPQVREAEASGLPVRALGRLEGADKALALRAADVLAIPEWIGLVAVDSLVSGRPIVTTHHPSHSPEAEYLDPGRNAVFTDHTPEAYASGLVHLLTSPYLSAIQQRCRNESSKYQIDEMADRFVEGILAWREWRGRWG